MAILSTSDSPPGALERVIVDSLRNAVEKIIDEEAQAAMVRVEQRITEARSSIAMNCLRHFDLSRQLDRIIITVKDDRP